MRAMVRIDDGNSWIAAHAASTKQAQGKLLFGYGQRPFSPDVRSVKDFETAIIQPVRQLEIIRMISVSHAQSRKAPSVLEIRVKREAVGFEWERSAAGMNFHGSREVVTQSGLETATPAGRLWWETTQGKEKRSEIEARIETPAAVKADLLGIQFVEIMQDSAVCETFVIVERMFKKAHATGVAINHQVFSNQTGRIGQAVGKLPIGRKQEQARGLRAVRADYNGLGPLQMRIFLLVEIDSASEAARTVHFQAMNVGIRANLAAAGALGHRDDAGERTGFCADFASEAPAKAAADASAASGTRLRKNCHRRGKRMPAQLASGAFKNHTGGFHREWRH